MADFYSDHYSNDQGVTGHFVTLLTAHKNVAVGKSHSRVRRKACYISVPNAQDLADNDVIRLMDFKSSDRLTEIYASMDANWGATTTFNIGLYLKGADNAGAVVDEDLFAGQIDWSGTIARVDYFNGANGSLDEWDRGKELWELAAIGAATDTVDPLTTYTLALTCSQDISAAAALVEMLIEVYYVAGD